MPVTSCSLQRPPRGVPGQGSRQGLDACTARMQTESLRPYIAAASPARGARARVPPGFRRVHSAHAICLVRSKHCVFSLRCAPTFRMAGQSTCAPAQYSIPRCHTVQYTYTPWRCITCRYLTMTLEQGRIRTWRLPAFSALFSVFNASASTLMRTMAARDLPRERAPVSNARVRGGGASLADYLGGSQRRRGQERGREKWQ